MRAEGDGRPDSPSGGRIACWGPRPRQAGAAGAGRGASSRPGPKAAGSDAPWQPALPLGPALLCGRQADSYRWLWPAKDRRELRPPDCSPDPPLTGEPTLSTRAFPDPGVLACWRADVSRKAGPWGPGWLQRFSSVLTQSGLEAEPKKISVEGEWRAVGGAEGREEEGEWRAGLEGAHRGRRRGWGGTKKRSLCVVGVAERGT